MSSSPGEYASALELTLRPLRPLLTRPDVMEICINRPAEVFLETRAGWRREAAAYADLDWCRRFARLVANFSRQRIDEISPLLSASLPSGERVQIALPPATLRQPVALAIVLPEPSRQCAPVMAVGPVNEPRMSSARSAPT